MLKIFIVLILSQSVMADIPTAVSWKYADCLNDFKRIATTGAAYVYTKEEDKAFVFSSKRNGVAGFYVLTQTGYYFFPAVENKPMSLDTGEKVSAFSSKTRTYHLASSIVTGNLFVSPEADLGSVVVKGQKISGSEFQAVIKNYSLDVIKSVKSSPEISYILGQARIAATQPGNTNNQIEIQKYQANVNKYWQEFEKAKKENKSPEVLAQIMYRVEENVQWLRHALSNANRLVHEYKTEKRYLSKCEQVPVLKQQIETSLGEVDRELGSYERQIAQRASQEAESNTEVAPAKKE